ncbi:MAG: glycoside hydrolase family 9 protein [Bacteroidota bacterium]
MRKRRALFTLVFYSASKVKQILFLLLIISLSTAGYAQVWTNENLSGVAATIRLNQVGYYPYGPKIAIVIQSGASKFSLLEKNKVVFSGSLTTSVNPALNGKKTLIADFTVFTKPGSYVISVDGLVSSSFVISPDAFKNLASAAVKAYYYQRASTALPEQFAGKWHRAGGHPDNQVLVHASAATAKRPTGTVISSPGGWYDAGDYNKYIVNNGVTVGTLLSLCEDFPAYIKTVKLNIPESQNKVPDILDEILYDVRWMLTMQDPDDGGVYNKLTNASFDGFVMPWVTKAPRYVVQKGTAATLDFAAMMAQTSRILKAYPKDFPGLADSCLAAAVKAWEWAAVNPNIAYDQDKMNTQYSPKISTGGYGDHNFKDEFMWAGCELYNTTGQSKYDQSAAFLTDKSMPLPSWGNVKLLGYYSLIRNRKKLIGQTASITDTLKNRVVAIADGLINGADDRAYRTVFGKSTRDFGWGSNSNAGNQGIALIQAYLITKDSKYLNYALSNLDYLLGRNGSGYSYVTGYGYKTPMHPHHRLSSADGVANPVPGLLVGGPNPGQQDGVKLPSTVPDEAYVDDEQSYATNEIAINWNAPLAYLANALEALKRDAGYTKK